MNILPLSKELRPDEAGSNAFFPSKFALEQFTSPKVADRPVVPAASRTRTSGGSAIIHAALPPPGAARPG